MAPPATDGGLIAFDGARYLDTEGVNEALSP